MNLYSINGKTYCSKDGNISDYDLINLIMRKTGTSACTSSNKIELLSSDVNLFEVEDILKKAGLVEVKIATIVKKRT